MHVAAPIYDGAEIIGAVTVAKPNRSALPVIERARRRLTLLGGGLILSGVLAGGLLSLWLSRSIRRLTRFAREVSAGHRPGVPQLPGRELRQLAEALESMRTQLEGKAYVERYVQTLTHELKSPLAAIAGAAELLRGDLAPAARERFLGNIDSETARLGSLSERLLRLSHLEQRRELEERVAVPLAPLVGELLEAQAARLTTRGARVDNSVPAGVAVRGESFLVRQALANLIDNAAEFVEDGGALTVSAEEAGDVLLVRVYNEGEPIPDYALPRVTERFYSLPRPATGRKSTGLGLSFVQETAELHGGTFHISNAPGGVLAELRLPRA
jgi:two-component system sensor histidine kinase CreC